MARLIAGRRSSAPPPPPPTALQLAAEAVGPGQFATFVASDQLSVADVHGPPATTTSIKIYASKGVYDAENRRAHFIGKAAGAGRPVRMVTYDEATDAWSLTFSGEPPNYDEFGHNYDAIALDPLTGTLYWRNYTQDASTSVDQWDGAAWGSGIAGPAGSHAITGSLEWFAELGSGGSLMWLDGNRGCHTRNGGTWTQRAAASALGGINGNYHVMSCYHPTRQEILLYAGGDPGFASNNLDVFTLASGGSVTQRDDLPLPINHAIGGVIIPDVVAGDYVALFSEDGAANREIYRFNPSASPSSQWADTGQTHALNTYPVMRIPYNNCHMIIDTVDFSAYTPQILLYRAS